jgi:hypothetical protein
MSSVTTFKACDYTRKHFHRPVYLRLVTCSGHLWNSVLISSVSYHLVAIHGTPKPDERNVTQIYYRLACFVCISE